MINGTASTILMVVLGLLSLLVLIYILYLMVRERGALHGLLGFLFIPYAYFWGWWNAKRLEMIDIMAFWTLISIIALAFPLAIAATSGISMLQTSSDFGPAEFSSQVNVQGPISSGSQVQGRIEEVFGVDEWSFSGQKGQSVTIRCAPVSGTSTDPRITLLAPDGRELAADDDGGEGRTALLEGVTLPADGTYRIQVDVWSPGPYLLQLN